MKLGKLSQGSLCCRYVIFGECLSYLGSVFLPRQIHPLK